MSSRVHAFADDALGDHDAVGLAGLMQRGEVSRWEVLEASIARVKRVASLRAVVRHCFDAPRTEARERAEGMPFSFVPFFIKDNVDMGGLPTLHGSDAMPTRPAKHDGAITKQILAQGFTVLGKSRLPEFGFSPSTEFQAADPTCNPWNPGYSSGASSGGSAALVASGAVPMAHANDGGGSIRIPAACCGLVGLKPTRGRLVTEELARRMPVNIVSEGVVTRTVRDTAHFYAAAERYYANPKLPPIGLVEGPLKKRLRIGLVLDSIGGVRTCPETRAAVEGLARKLARLGHHVEPLTPRVPEFFIDDFKLYWSFLAFSVASAGNLTMAKGFDATKLDGLTLGLAKHFKRRAWRLPLALARLRASSLPYASQFKRLDAVLSPVLTHTVPKLGYLSPNVPFAELFERIQTYSAFTPLNNATGGPGIAVPVGLSSEGLPLSAHFSAAHGAEGVLLSLAYEVEGELGFPRIARAT